MDDMAGILNLVKSIKHHMIKESKSRGRIGRIRLSVNCFIPKAFTPFQWFPMESVSSLKEKQKWLKGAFSKEGGARSLLMSPNGPIFRPSCPWETGGLVPSYCQPMN